MAVSVQSKCAFSTRSAVRARSVRVEAVHGAVERVQMAAISFATAALLVGPAHAGVVMQQQTLKKAFVDDAPARVKAAAATKSASPSAPAVKAEKKDEAPTSDIIDPRLIALPVSIGFVGGLALVASKVDSEFDDFMAATLIKDSNLGQSGLGYEAVIKSTYGGIYGEPTAKGAPKTVKKKK